MTASIDNFKKKRIYCMAAALIISLCAGFGYAWSVLQAPIIEIHGWSDSSVSLAYTLTVVCSTLTSLCLGAFIRKMGTKKSVLLGSVLFGGGLFLLLVDNFSRNISTTEIPIGILTAFIGAPFFLLLITRRGEFK